MALQILISPGTSVAQPRKRVPVLPVADLSPIKASPNPSPAPPHIYHNANTSANMSATAKAKENISSFNRLAATVAGDVKKERGTPTNGRKPFGALNANATQNLPVDKSAQSHTQRLVKKPSGHSHGAKAVKILGDVSTNGTVNVNGSFTAANTSKDSTSSVRDRVKEWERERERLREMARLEEMEKERDEIYKREKKRREKERKMEVEADKDGDNARSEVLENDEEPMVVKEVAQEVGEDESEIVKERRDASHLHIHIPGAMSPTSASGRPSLGLSGNTDTKAIAGIDVGPKRSNRDWDWDKENIGSSSATPVLPMFRTGPPLTQGMYTFATKTG